MGSGNYLAQAGRFLFLEGDTLYLARASSDPVPIKGKLWMVRIVLVFCIVGSRVLVALM